MIYRLYKKLFKKKSLEDVLNATKKVKVEGIFFIIKKIDGLDYLSGAQVMQSTFDTWNNKSRNPDDKIANTAMKRAKEHLIDVFMAGVVEPKLKRKDEGEGILVDNLFTDWDLALGLYEAINEFTYGKKKSK